MTARRRVGALLALVFSLLLADAIQRHLYVSGAALPKERGTFSDSAPCTRAILMVGKALDESERATGWRDLSAADRFLEQIYGARLHTRVLGEGATESDFFQALAKSGSNDNLVIFLTGHGGGRNFNCGQFSLTREGLARRLYSSRYRSLLLVIDCCWSGEFLRSFADNPPGDIVTSTDAEHESPFPTSFVGPASFGCAFFQALARGLSSGEAVAAVNQRRARWSWLYPSSMGTQGMCLRRP